MTVDQFTDLIGHINAGLAVLLFALGFIGGQQ